MGFTEATLQVLKIADRHPVHLPLAIVSNPPPTAVIHNKYYAQGLFHRAMWKIGKFCVIFLGCYLLCFRVIPLAASISSAESTTLVKQLEELGVQTLFIAMGVSSTSCYRTFERDEAEFCFLINETFKLLQVAARMGALINTSKGTIEYFVYGVGVGFYTSPLLFCLFPFARTYDPVQWTMIKLFEIGNTCLPVKIWAAITYLIVLSLAMHSALFAVLLGGLCLDCGQRISAKLVGVLTQPNLDLPSKSVIRLQLRQRLKLYQKLRIFIIVFNSVFQELMSLLVWTCIKISVWCACISIGMWGILPMLLYGICVLFLVGALGTIFIYVHFASSSHRNGNAFRKLWGRCCERKIDRVQLRSCPEIGFSLYPAVKHVKGMVWKFSKFCIPSLAVYLLCFRVIPLAASISSVDGTKLIQKLEELGVHMFFIALGAGSIFCYRTIERHLPDLCFVINEAVKLLEFATKTGSSTTTVKGAIESFVYGIAVGFYLCPILVFLFPFVRPYDPIQWTVLQLFNLRNTSIPLKLCAGVFYIFNFSHAIHVALMVVLLMGTGLDCGQRISTKLYNILGQTNLEIPPKSVIRLQFRQRLKLYQKLRIFITLFHSVFEEFVSVLLCTCIQVSIWCSCIVTSMWGILPLVIYGNCVVFLIAAIGAILIFVEFASGTYKNGKEFKMLWRRSCPRKQERLQLKSCPDIGFAVYPAIKHVREYTALIICNVILNYTATLIILKAA
ncbi:unnamed protein product [Orchesella dallaii]|uniref:Uncharacterized protein n=1 Tax=Orchesella dallaii TaxID=48710 RepID=A0ABP1RJS9_9HEXA